MPGSCPFWPTNRPTSYRCGAPEVSVAMTSMRIVSPAMQFWSAPAAGWVKSTLAVKSLAVQLSVVLARSPAQNWSVMAVTAAVWARAAG